MLSCKTILQTAQLSILDCPVLPLVFVSGTSCISARWCTLQASRRTGFQTGSQPRKILITGAVTLGFNVGAAKGILIVALGDGFFGGTERLPSCCP